MNIRPSIPPGAYWLLGVFAAGAIFSGLWLTLPILAVIAWLVVRSYKRTSMCLQQGSIVYTHGSRIQTIPLDAVGMCDTAVRAFTAKRVNLRLHTAAGTIMMRNARLTEAQAFCAAVLQARQPAAPASLSLALG